MPSASDERTAHGGSRHGPWPVRPLGAPLVPQPRSGAEDVLRVTVVGPDAEQRRRLAGLLAQVAGIEVVGWVDSARALAALDGRNLGAVVSVPQLTTPGDRLRQPDLSPRQRDVLVAYTVGNDLLDVAARRLRMKPESFKTHLRRVRAKYRQVGRPAPTRRDLYVRAVEDGLLPPPS